MPKIDLASLAGMVQQYISRKYAAALIDRTKVAELKAYIAQYLYDTGFTVDGYTEKTLAERLYSEMAEYSVLTHYLDDPDVEEININGWDDMPLHTSTVGSKRPKSISFPRSTHRMWSKSCFSIRV